MRDAVNLLDQLATSYGARRSTLEHVRDGLGLIGDERSGRLARLALRRRPRPAASSSSPRYATTASTCGSSSASSSPSCARCSWRSRAYRREDGATIERQRELQQAVHDVPRRACSSRCAPSARPTSSADPHSTLPLDIALAERRAGLGR